MVRVKYINVEHDESCLLGRHTKLWYSFEQQQKSCRLAANSCLDMEEVFAFAFLMLYGVVIFFEHLYIREFSII